MKTYPLNPNLKQNHNNYTIDDKTVWKTLFERQMELLQHLAANEFIEAVSEIGFTASEIPNFDKVNRLLHSKTGWKIEVVDGIINERDFFQLLAEKKFPATTWLRKLNELDYLPEPDMFHDVFGHLPLLINKDICDFYEAFGKIGILHHENPEVITKLGRLYWFTVEFGLIQKEKLLQIYGAGILSSYGESKYALGNEPRKLPFDVERIMNTDFDNSVIQNTYYVINSFDDLFNSLQLVEKLISKKDTTVKYNAY